MMENHSFDNLLGMVPHQVKGRAQVDGLTVKGGKVVNSNPSSVAPYGIKSPPVTARLASSPCQVSGHPTQAWNASHLSWNNGPNNGFVQASTDVAMWYWDEHYAAVRPTRWRSTTRSASATSARCSRRPTRTGASCSAGPPPG